MLPLRCVNVSSFEKNEVESALNRLYEYEKISECVILSTCNRTEIYAVLEDVQSPKAYMLDVLKAFKTCQRQLRNQHFSSMNKKRV